MLRTNASDGNVILFEYINGKRLERQVARRRIEAGKWHNLKLDIARLRIRGYVNGESCIEYTADRSLSGYLGLRTKSDSVTCFDGLTVDRDTI